MGLFSTTPLKNRQGSALVFAMGISLLVVALSVALLLWLTLDIRRVQQLQAGSQRLALIELVEAMAAEKIQGLPELWDEPWTLEREEITINAQLTDLTGRLNINTLFKQDLSEGPAVMLSPKAVLIRLLESVPVTGGQLLVEDLADTHHILLGTKSLPAWAAAHEYLYAAPPEQQTININSTSPVVLSSILDVSTASANLILSHKPFKTKQEIHQALNEQKLTYEPASLIDDWLGVEGHYYVLETTIQQKRMVRIYSVFHKDGDKITLQWRSWGTLP